MFVVGASVNVSVVALPCRKVRPPLVGPPDVKSKFATHAPGSGHSAYGLGLAVAQVTLAVAPPATREPAAVATAAPSMTCVESGTAQIAIVEFVTAPVVLVTGIVSDVPYESWLESWTIRMFVFDWSPSTIAVRGGHAFASRTTHARGSFSTPFCTP